MGPAKATDGARRIATKAGRSPPVASARMRLAKVLGAIGRACITAGHAAPAVRRLPAVGHRASGRPRPRTGWRTSSRACSTRRPNVTTTTHARTSRDRRRPSPRRRRGRGDRAASRSPRSAWTRSSSRASASPTSRRAPATTRRRRCPGQEGNAAIAGHRTTYGAPFNRIDELEPGDEIIVQTVQGEFRYIVERAADRLARPGRGARGQGRQPAHPHGLPPEVQRPAAHRRGGRARPRPGRRLAAPASPGTPSRLDDIERRGAPGLGRRSSSACCARRSGSSPGRSAGSGASGRPTSSALPFFLVALFFFFEEFSRLLPSQLLIRRRPQRPRKRGRRRSRKAAMPSWRSSLPQAASAAACTSGSSPRPTGISRRLRASLCAGDGERRERGDLVGPRRGPRRGRRCAGRARAACASSPP